MAVTHYDRPTQKSDWQFPMLLGSHLDDWPALTGLGYPDLSVLDEVSATSGMRIEEYRDDGELVVRAEVPGVDPDTDIQITLSNGSLDIHVVRREEHESTDAEGFYRSEFGYGEFYRRISVPAGVTRQDVQASYRDGILEIHVPVRTEEEAERVPISRD